MCGNIEIKPRFLCVVQISLATHFLLRENYERMGLMFILLIILLCFVAWKVFLGYVALYVISIGVVVAVLYGIGKYVVKTESGQKLGTVLSNAISWCFSTSKRSILTITCLIVSIFLGMVVYDSFQPQVSDMSIEYKNWEEQESFMGVPYEIEKHGYSITNNGEQNAYIKLKITYYDESMNVIDDSHISCTLSPGENSILEFEVDDDVETFDYTIVEIKKP